MTVFLQALLTYLKKCGGPLAAAVGLLAVLEVLKSILLYLLPEHVHFIVEFGFSFLDAAQEFSDAVAQLVSRWDFGALSVLFLKTVLLLVHLLIIAPVYLVMAWLMGHIRRLFK
jgi:hypothetical protein